MSRSERYAVILAGGGGTRLWPASRRARPKQLLDLGGGETLLAATARRLELVCDRSRIAVVCAADQRDGVAAALDWLAPENLIAEPEGRDTAAAIGLAAVVLGARDPDAVIAAMPADHFIGDEEAFAGAANAAFDAAAAGDVVATIGIVPSRPETGYGYLELAPPSDDDSPVREVVRFVEKPDAETARGYLDSGRHMWNAGMFFARADRWRAAFAAHLPETAAALDAIAGDLDRPERWAEAYAAMPRVSIDIGVMEKLAPGDGGAAAIVCVPGDFAWSDVGSWAALPDVSGRDGEGNAHLGEVYAIDAAGNICVASEGTVIGVVGVRDLIVVATGDAVLVTTADRAQEVRELVVELAARGREDVL